jgi:hypothetical protein
MRDEFEDLKSAFRAEPLVAADEAAKRQAISAAMAAYDRNFSVRTQ